MAELMARKLESSSKREPLPCGGWIERGTIKLPGSQDGYTEDGAVWAPKQGFVEGYVKLVDGKPWLCTWMGERLVQLEHVSSWPVRSWIGSHMHAYRAIIDGRDWYGRGHGEGTLCKLRPSKKGV